MSTRKRKRIIADDEDYLSSVSSSSLSYNIDEEDYEPFRNERDPLPARSKKQRKIAKICATNDEVLRAIQERAPFTISASVTTLKITDALLDDNVVQHLCSAVSDGKNALKRIELHIRSLLSILKANKKLEELFIKYDKPKNAADEYFNNLFLLLPKLSVLWLENCSFSAKFLRQFFLSIITAPGAMLQKCALINCNVMQADLEPVSNPIFVSVNLLELNISNNRIQGTTHISKLVAEAQITDLDLTNCHIDDEGLKPLCDQLSMNYCSLKQLKLGQNNIGAAGLDYLVEKLNNNLRLKYLDLRGIEFSPACVQIISQKLRCKSLETVLLDVNVPEMIDLTITNQLKTSPKYSALSEAIESNKWNVVWESIIQKPNTPLRYLIPLDKISMEKARDLHQRVIDGLKNHVTELNERLQEETAKQTSQKERVEYLTNRKIELENELKQLVAELKEINDRPAIELKAREKDIETYSNCLKLTEESKAVIESVIQQRQDLAKKPVIEWSNSEVLTLMKSLGLSSFDTVMINNKIDGGVLAHLTTTDYRQLGFSFVNTMRIVKALFIATHFKTTEAPPGVLRWTTNDVKEWLTNHNFSHLIDNFTKHHQITGGELLFLQTPDLKNWLQVHTAADRVNLEKAIDELKNSVIGQKPTTAAKVKVPKHFKCPITQEIMKDPVVTSDGHTYERAAIEQWLVNHDTSPMTNDKLTNKQVHPCHYLKNMIAEFLQQNQNN